MSKDKEEEKGRKKRGGRGGRNCFKPSHWDLIFFLLIALISWKEERGKGERRRLGCSGPSRHYNAFSPVSSQRTCEGGKKRKGRKVGERGGGKGRVFLAIGYARGNMLYLVESMRRLNCEKVTGAKGGKKKEGKRDVESFVSAQRGGDVILFPLCSTHANTRKGKKKKRGSMNRELIKGGGLFYCARPIQRGSGGGGRRGEERKGVRQENDGRTKE